MVIRVAKPGLLTTIQDEGRWGYQRFGVPVAGPMDRWSHRLANLLVGNRQSAATLEVTLVGPELEFQDRVLFAVTGARFELYLNGSAVPMNTTHVAHRGQRLVVGRRLEGARAYVAVVGGFDVPIVMGSRATHVGSGMGGLNGRPLASGDRLRVGHEVSHTVQGGETRPAAFELPRHGARVRVILGPHDDLFGLNAIETFIATRYLVTTQSDRMGYRLKGDRLQRPGGDDLISMAAPIGSVQVPPAGEPIILMADHQTSGGYPRIATIITADLAVVGQLSPSDGIEFEPCDQEVALKELVAHERSLMW